MSPTMPVPTPIQMSQGGGRFPPPPIDIGNRFQCRCRGGNAQQTMSVDRRGGESSPPWLRHRKPFPMSLGGGKAPPPLETFELEWGRAWLGTWLHVPTGLRRGDGRSETVFVASGRDCVFSLPPPASGSEEEGGRAFGNRFRCLLQGLCIFAPPLNGSGEERGWAFGNRFCSLGREAARPHQSTSDLERRQAVEDIFRCLGQARY